MHTKNDPAINKVSEIKQWCPMLKMMVEPVLMVCAHIILYSLGDEVARKFFERTHRSRNLWHCA